MLLDTMEKAKPKQKGIETSIPLPKGVTASYQNNILHVHGSEGDVQRLLADKRVSAEIGDGKIILKSRLDGKRERKMIGTFRAHIKNMLKGCHEMHRYELKICSGHFPMTVTATKDEFIVKNLLGEKIPRVLKLKKGASVKVEGDKVVVESTSKETAGQTAADIEQLTRRTGYDTRVFQDGIFITNKDGKDLK